MKGCPWGKESDQQWGIGDGNWGLETGTGDRHNGKLETTPSFLEFFLDFPSPQLELTNQPACLPSHTPVPTPVLDPSVLAEMGDTCTNGTHPPSIQAFSPPFMSSFLQTTVSRVWPLPTRPLDHSQ